MAVQACPHQTATWFRSVWLSYVTTCCPWHTASSSPSSMCAFVLAVRYVQCLLPCCTLPVLGPLGATRSNVGPGVTIHLVQVAKRIQVCKLKWKVSPLFCAEPFLDSLELRAVFKEPGLLRRHPRAVPKLHVSGVHASGEDFRDLCRIRDAKGCLLLALKKSHLVAGLVLLL